MGCLWGSAWRPFGPPELRYKGYNGGGAVASYAWLARSTPERVLRVQALAGNIKHLMTGPEGNSEFCFP